NDVATFDENCAIVVGDEGAIFATTDAGITWQSRNSAVTNSFYGIETLNSNFVWLVGEEGVVLFSSDRGITWIRLSLPKPITIRDIAIIDSTELYVVGNNGKIFYTIDNGLNWYGQYAETSYDLYAIDFIDRTHGFAVGNGGTILSTTSSGTLTDVRASIASLPETFHLYQNYPNPFNPITTIAYEISRPSYVVIKVYNTLGQEVREIVNGYHQSGRHNITWNADNTPSGVYYYRIVAQEFGIGRTFSEVKKAVLIK
ncbi:MAG TPA: YCF48-related protein, partial [Bacteroidota bacterium]|nr:YCF48-related protein [Bacteroidota bacterium]